jgi:uncharacterized protein (TIGR00251 family)
VTPVQPADGGVRLLLYVQPRASRTELAGQFGDALKVRIASPPVEGAANAELVRFLAETLGVRTAAVKIRSGETGRRKTITVSGITVELAARRLGLPFPFR